MPGQESRIINVSTDALGSDWKFGPGARRGSLGGYRRRHAHDLADSLSGAYNTHRWAQLIVALDEARSAAIAADTHTTFSTVPRTVEIPAIAGTGLFEPLPSWQKNRTPKWVSCF
ncbi:MAG: hypothetical protein J5482_04030, partial [Oscillospiraceae bacterium]|nr:hypothetical protein [Oscillospiraceae bacterium]